MPSTPLKRRIFPLISVATNKAAIPPPRPICRTQRGLPRLIVIWLIFWTRIDGPIQFSHRDSAKVSNPPCWPNFAQNMHPNKRCRRSLARPNRTTPEYHNVDHGVVVGRPRRFCIIAHIAFVGGMGGWCCRTWCAVVFAVVLRSCASIFLFHVNKMHQLA
jgi:hypothetical protein